MLNLNKVTICGCIGKEPELKYTQQGTAVLSLSVATNRIYKNAKGEQVKEVEWHKILLFSKQAETASKYFHKGDPIYIEGRVRTRKYTAKDGTEKYATEIIANDFQFVKSREAGQSPQATAEPSGVISDEALDIPF